MKDNDRELIDEIIQLNLTRIDKKFIDIENRITVPSNDKPYELHVMDVKSPNRHHSRSQSGSNTISLNSTGNNFNGNVNNLNTAGGMKFVTSEHVNKMFHEIVNELEKKIIIINDNMKSQFKIMDVNLVDVIQQKNAEFDQLSNIVKNLENNIASVIKQIQNLSNSNENIQIKVEEAIKKSLTSNVK